MVPAGSKYREKFSLISTQWELKMYIKNKGSIMFSLHTLVIRQKDYLNFVSVQEAYGVVAGWGNDSRLLYSPRISVPGCTYVLIYFHLLIFRRLLHYSFIYVM